MEIKKVPNRRCIVCGEIKNKKNLIRIVRVDENNFCLDFTGKKNGRGAYICNSISCVKELQKKKVLDRSFKQKIDIKIYEKLSEELMELNNEE